MAKIAETIVGSALGGIFNKVSYKPFSIIFLLFSVLKNS